MARNKTLACLIIFLLLLIPACNRPDIVQAPAGTAAAGLPAVTVTDKTAKPVPTRTARPSKLSAIAKQPEILATWFLQDSSFRYQVFFAFVVRNPNPDLALEKAEYQFVAYDAADTVLGKVTGQIGVLFPGEQRAMSKGYDLYVPDKSTVKRVSMEISRPAEAFKLEPGSNPFTAGKVTYFQDQVDGPRITGEVQNHLKYDIYNLYVTAIAYDKNGNIIGAGTDAAYARIHPTGIQPVLVRIQMAGEPAKVALYPFVYEKWYTGSGYPLEPAQVTAIGGRQDQYGATSWGMILENRDSWAHFDMQLNLIAYDENGLVLDIGRDVIAVIFPGERLGLAGHTRLPENTELRKVVAQIGYDSIDYSDRYGFQKAGITRNPLTAEAAPYDQSLGGRISGTVRNSSGMDLDPIMVTAIAYAADGGILGGWETTIGSVPANGQAAFTIHTNLTSPPARIELYPTWKYISAQD